MKSDFNRIAPYYDFLARLVFGSKLEQSQRLFLDRIQAGQSVLILGGGTGRILSWLPAGCEVTYVEQSANMLEKARRIGDVHFVQADFLHFSVSHTYDWIICPFFLDCFDKQQLDQAIGTIARLLADDGHLIVTDFRHDGRLKTKVMLWLMHRFFRLTAQLASSRLQDLHMAILTAGFECVTWQAGKSATFSGLYSLRK